MKRFRDYMLGVMTVVMILAVALPAMAASYNQNMSVTYRDIKISVNGTYFTPKDANGRTVEPFIYEGTTYLPVRATAEAVGYNVTWDNNTSTVFLTNGGGSSGGTSGGNQGGSAVAPAVNLIDTITPFASTSNVTTYPTSGANSITMGGTSYKNAITLGGNSGGHSANFNLSGKYTLLSGTIGAVDNSASSGYDHGDFNMTVNFYGDGSLIKSLEVTPTGLPTSFSMGVVGVSDFKVEVISPHNSYVGNYLVGMAELLIQ